MSARSGIGNDGQPGGLARAREALAQDQRQAAAEERQREPRHDLVGPEVDGHDRVQQAQQRRRPHREREARARVAGRDRRREPGHGAHEHHSLDAQVQDARPLREDLADRREQQDGPGRDAGREHQRQVHRAHVAAWPAPVRSTRTR